MYGEGNGTKLISDIVNTTTQVSEGLTQSMGIDLRALLAGLLGGRLAAGPEPCTWVRPPRRARRSSLRQERRPTAARRLESCPRTTNF